MLGGFWRSRQLQDVLRNEPKTAEDGLKLETPLGERSERSEQSDQDGLGELPSESCSKDAFKVREGRLRKAIQHAYARQTCLVWLARVPARFHLQRASRSYVNTRFPKNALVSGFDLYR